MKVSRIRRCRDDRFSLGGHRHRSGRPHRGHVRMASGSGGVGAGVRRRDPRCRRRDSVGAAPARARHRRQAANPRGHLADRRVGHHRRGRRHGARTRGAQRNAQSDGAIRRQRYRCGSYRRWLFVVAAWLLADSAHFLVAAEHCRSCSWFGRSRQRGRSGAAVAAPHPDRVLGAARHLRPAGRHRPRSGARPSPRSKHPTRAFSPVRWRRSCVRVFSASTA